MLRSAPYEIYIILLKYIITSDVATTTTAAAADDDDDDDDDYKKNLSKIEFPMLQIQFYRFSIVNIFLY